MVRPSVRPSAHRPCPSRVTLSTPERRAIQPLSPLPPLFYLPPGGYFIYGSEPAKLYRVYRSSKCTRSTNSRCAAKEDRNLLLLYSLYFIRPLLTTPRNETLSSSQASLSLELQAEVVRRSPLAAQPPKPPPGAGGGLLLNLTRLVLATYVAIPSHATTSGRKKRGGRGRKRKEEEACLSSAIT